MVKEYEDVAPKAVKILEDGFEDSMTVMSLQEKLRIVLRTTNTIESLLVPNLVMYKLITRYYYGTENTGGNPSSYGNVTYTNTYGKIYTTTTSYETAQPLSSLFF